MNVRTENSDAFDVNTALSHYVYGFPNDGISVFNKTSAQEQSYREASKRNPLETILVQVGGYEGEHHTIYELVPSGSGFFVGSRFKSQNLKTPAGIILFKNPKSSGGTPIPTSSSEIDETQPAVIRFRDSSNQEHVLNLSDYAAGRERINWTRILRDTGTADQFEVSYTAKNQRKWVREISKKPLVGWAEFDLTSPMDFENGITPGQQYFTHLGDEVRSIINVQEEFGKIRGFILNVIPRNVDANTIDRFATNSKTHAEMLNKIFYGLTGTRNASLYKGVCNLAQSFIEMVDAKISATPSLGHHPDIQATLSRLDVKIPQVYFYGDWREPARKLDDLVSRGDVNSEMSEHLKPVGSPFLSESPPAINMGSPSRPSRLVSSHSPQGKVY